MKPLWQLRFIFVLAIRACFFNSRTKFWGLGEEFGLIAKASGTILSAGNLGFAANKKAQSASEKADCAQ